ncbi:methylamine utilization protein [Paraglaciecola aestuariivivens]
MYNLANKLKNNINFVIHWANQSLSAALNILCLSTALSLLYSTSLRAETVQIVDQNGQPIENVVISFKQDAPASASSETATMDQVNIQFLPQVLVIQKNQMVKFPNSDNTRHHIYSFSKAKPFEIKMFRGGESKQLAFEQPGIVVLGCNIHDQMVGYIYVAENSNTAMTDAQGLAEVPSGLAIQLWHPKLSSDKVTRVDALLPQDMPNQPYKIELALLPEVKQPVNNTFKSKKFSRGFN